MIKLSTPLLFAFFTVTFMAGFASAHTQARQTVTNVLLVHGAFAASSSWNKIIPLLEAKGLHVVTVNIPLTSFDDDVAVTKKAIADETGPVLLVGHSYGGSVITEAGDDPKVAGLVYVAAYAPDKGESTEASGAAFPKMASLAEFEKAPDGLISLSNRGISEYFAPDLSTAEQNGVFASQIPLAAASLGKKLSNAAWKTKPSWYIVSTDDQIINPAQEKSMAEHIGAETTDIPSSHVVMLSHPKQTATVIIQAAAGK